RPPHGVPPRGPPAETDAKPEPEPEVIPEIAPIAQADEQPTAPLAAPVMPGPSTRTVRVDAERLDALMHSMGELVIHRTAVEALTAGLDVPGLQQAMQELTRSS